MIVEITGTHFQNKGAELMMAAIASELLKNNHTPAIMPWSGSFNQRARYGLHQIMWYQRYKIPWSSFPSPFPKRLRRQYGLIKQSEVDFVFDASGFKYSDQWGAGIVNKSLHVYREHRKRKARLIMMPQAFGPFQDPSVKEATKRIVDYADLVFARDHRSFEYLGDLGVDQNKLRMRPDFTILLKGIVPDIPFVQQYGNRKLACIVPNYRMVDKYYKGNASPYIEFMTRSIFTLLEHDYFPFILIHEKDTDQGLADTIVNSINRNVPIVYNDHPLEIKGLIGLSKIFLGSRFHGLVNALSQGVPTFGMGWSHKYEMLFGDYRCSEYLVSPDGSEIGRQLVSLIDDNDLPSKLKAISEQIKKEVHEMWKEIFELMDGKAVK